MKTVEGHATERASVQVIVAALLLGAIVWVWPAHVASQAPSFDLVIKDGRIVDGTGSPWFVGDVGISGDTIVSVAGAIDPRGARTIDARGLVVAPGFVDVHSHAEARDDNQDIIGNPAGDTGDGLSVVQVLCSTWVLSIPARSTHGVRNSSFAISCLRAVSTSCA